jgi:biopolymer transport protein ExbD
MASMIDVTFLLLIYFMVTMILTPTEDRRSPTLQTRADSSSGPSSDFQPQVVEVLVVDGAPGYRIGRRVVRVRDELAEILAGLPVDPGLFVQVSDGVPVGLVATAIQLARDAGFEKVTYVPAE